MTLKSLLFLIATTNVLGVIQKEYKQKKYSSIHNIYTANINSLPKSWSWDNINGTHYLTKNLNQHIPQYCGSCWAHGAISALGDRIKIARGGKSPDINLAVQFLLNCGNAGTCNGGDHLAAYEFIYNYGSIPFDTCLAYEACSDDSEELNCKHKDYTCKPENVCRTCSTFTNLGGKCKSIYPYPNATIYKYGTVSGYKNMMHEIYNNGPIACGINANEILSYRGGLLDVPDKSNEVDHIISIVGWGYDKNTDKQYWNIRNSWGEYWGEMGYVRVVLGENQLGTESNCAWALPKTWTELNVPCDENGENC